MTTKSSLLHRLRGTPKSLRRRLGLSSDSVDPGHQAPGNGDLQSSKATSESGGHSEEFNCRFLGERTVYTLKPEDCYKFALDLEAHAVEKALTKAIVKINQKAVEISYQLPSPTLLKNRSKTSALFTPPPGSPLLRKQASVSSSRTNSDNASPMSPPAATTIFDTPYYRPHRSTTEDDFSVFPKSRYESEFNNNHQMNGETWPDAERTFSHVFETRQRSYTFNGAPESRAMDSDKVLLHDIAYCVTLPSRPRIFLLTSRGRDALTCRAFLFPRREKAHALKHALATQFQRSYHEWQAKCARIERRASLSPTKNALPNAISVSHARLSSASSSVTSNDDVSDDDDVMSEEEEAMHREFQRRASCLPNPDQLSVGDGALEALRDRFNEALGDR